MCAIVGKDWYEDDWDDCDEPPPTDGPDDAVYF
jgi:hypothetical protein